ncbi:MAG: reverse transcriptase-like protein [Gemmatimonadaceae bacterium]|nr:reverse transcriptase-like protein [Gemmatimonadaceae bacterium]
MEAGWSSIHALRVQTTRLSTFERERVRWPVSLRRRHSTDAGRTWVFTDGGGSGRFSAVVLRPRAGEHRMAGRRQSPSNSVVAELDGVVLGLEDCRPRERVTIVSDYLWTAYYINGWRRVRHPHLREGVIRARSSLEKLKSAVFVHYVLETGGECAFRRWNAVAHDLCQDSSSTHLPMARPS